MGWKRLVPSLTRMLSSIQIRFHFLYSILSLQKDFIILFAMTIFFLPNLFLRHVIIPITNTITHTCAPRPDAMPITKLPLVLH